jgi:hypothetical protein
MENIIDRINEYVQERLYHKDQQIELLTQQLERERQKTAQLRRNLAALMSEDTGGEQEAPAEAHTDTRSATPSTTPSTTPSAPPSSAPADAQGADRVQDELSLREESAFSEIELKSGTYFIDLEDNLLYLKDGDKVGDLVGKLKQITHKSKQYVLDTVGQDIYVLREDGDIGELVGKLVGNKIRFV